MMWAQWWLVMAGAWVTMPAWAAPGGAETEAVLGESELERAVEIDKEVVRLFGERKVAEAMLLAKESLAIRRAAPGDHRTDVASSLNNLAAIHQASGDFPGARPLYEESLAIRREVLGEEHIDVAVSLNNLAALVASQGDLREARRLYEQSLATTRGAVGDAHPRVAQTLFNLAGVVKSQGDFADAAALFEQSLEIWRTADGATQINVATGMHGLAQVRAAQGDFTGARPLFEQSLEIWRAELGEQHPTVAKSLTALGGLHFGRGDYRRSQELYEEALAISRAAYGDQHPDVALSLGNLAIVHKKLGNYEVARSLHEQCLAIQRVVFGEEHFAVARSLDFLAALLQEQGDSASARPLFERSLEIRRASLGEGHVSVAHSLNNLAHLFLAEGEYGRARPLYERSLEIRRGALGEQHVDVASSLNNLANLAQSQGDYPGSRRLSEQSLDIRLAVLGEEHPSVAGSLNSLASLLSATGDHAAALPLYERSLSVLRAAYGEEHIEVASTLNNLAGAVAMLGDLDRALLLYEQSLAIGRGLLGEEHPSVGKSLHNLAGVHRKQRDYAGARQLFDQSLAIKRATLGEEHPEVAIGLFHLAGLLQDQGEHAEARSLYEESLAIRTKRLDLLTTLSDREGAEYLASVRRFLSHWFATYDGAEDAKVGWRHLLSWKGAGTLRLLERAHTARAATGEAMTALQDLTKTRRALAAEVYATYDPERAEARKARIQSLTEDKERLERSLGRATEDDDIHQQASPSAEAVCAQLSPGTVLIDIFRYETSERAAYLAFVATPECRVTRVELGDAEELDTSVARWRRLLVGALENPLASARASAAGRQVADRVWPQLGPHLEGAEAVWLVPDGGLTALPWAALPVDGERLLVEEVEIQILPTAGAVLAPESRLGSGLLTLAGVAYGDPDVSPAPCLDEPFGPLAATRAESEGIVDIWRRKQRREHITRLQDSSASEAEFSSAAPGNRVLHLATHGFFASERCRSAAGASDGVGMNPMLLSGLVLAGANDAHDPLADEDGYLTAEEVAGLDLRGAELVLLSACETGLGTTRPGEGVMGLQRGFALAGAGSVVMSLWSVPDEETSELMQRLVRQALSRKRLQPAAALRDAQLAALESNRREYGEPSAQTWAAWVVSGHGR